jgi:hypothetical protein
MHMQHGQGAWTCRVDLQSGPAAWDLEIKYGPAASISGIQRQHVHVACSIHNMHM